MGGPKFLPVHPAHIQELSGNIAAELYYEYLVFCSNMAANRWFARSVADIEKALKMKRYVQESSRRLLIAKGWIDCRVASSRSPTVEYRILSCGKLVNK